ncbi:HAD hydrolase-like protein [Variovorax atrisoli]|uniref:HAD hydrolase-like protein n=1 Tax=Variovorax atrisoli TaxID=3394203 RepID=UPI003392443A
MFELCLFDLDDTLVRTSDLDEIRRAGKNDNSANYRRRLSAELGKIAPRLIYPESLLAEIRAANPGMRLGVFTRSPRSYASVVLQKAYPNTEWDVVVAFEDVQWTKPYGYGVHAAMKQLKIKSPTSVVLVGDNDVDVCAAYHAGSTIVIDKSAWPFSNTRDHWAALGHVPDAFITSPRDLLDVLASPNRHLPELERLFAGAPAGPTVRFDEIGHFKPRGFEEPRGPVRISVCGRSFSNHNSLTRRREDHALTASIEDNKDSTEFPQEWIDAVLAFAQKRYPLLIWGGALVVTVVPHRPEREPRLENFLGQLADAVSGSRRLRNVVVEPDLLAFKDGVRSQHGDRLGQTERFENVRDHLYVNRPDLVNGKSHYLVIDDVTTTGASLIYAHQYLLDAGAQNVACLSIAKNVGELFWKEK